MKLKSLSCAAVILSLVFVLVVAYVLFSPGEDTPEVTLPAAQDGGGNIHGSDNLGLGKYTAADITPETVQSVIATLARAESYSRGVTVETYWDGGSSSARLDCYVRGEDSHIISTSDGRIRHVLILADQIYIWYGDNSRHYTGSAVGYRPEIIDEFSKILLYEELLSLDTDLIIDAGYLNFAGEGCVFAKYTTGDFGYTTEIYVSISTGLLMGAQRFDGETEIYSMSSDTPVLEVSQDSWFNVPS